MVLKRGSSEKLLQHIMATVGNPDIGAESVVAGVSEADEGGEAEAQREALLNAPSDAESDEEEAELKRGAPINCGHIVTWGVPVSIEAVCRMRLKPRTSRNSTHASRYSHRHYPLLGAGTP